MSGGFKARVYRNQDKLVTLRLNAIAQQITTLKKILQALILGIKFSFAYYVCSHLRSKGHDIISDHTIAFSMTFILVGDKDLFQGDMRLTPLQSLLALSGGDVSQAGSSSNAFGSAKNKGLLWLPSKVVPYEISPDLGK